MESKEENTLVFEFKSETGATVQVLFNRGGDTIICVYKKMKKEERNPVSHPHVFKDMGDEIIAGWRAPISNKAMSTILAGFIEANNGEKDGF